MTDYDGDSMGGLMPQIVALTAPPGPRDATSGMQNAYNGPSNTITFGSQTETTGLAAHPYFRRPGKGHNHDSCDACSEGGDLICCDICPASFHLNCHDPPLDEDNIPVGEWMCHECRIKKDDDKVTNNRNGKNVKVLKKKEKIEEDDNKVWTSGRQMEISKTPLTPLVKAAALTNPKQFSIPYELTVPANFPNEPKDSGKRNGRRGWGKKKPYELDNGLTPRPAILCFQCNKSCRIGPMIPCDYCNLFYHLDCVNPPLTIPPTGKWMCPTHPEHFVDANLGSHSLIERVKIWDKFSGPLDEHSVKLNFIRKCNKERTNNKFKIRKVTRSRIKVPVGVKNHYSNPPELLPHLSSSTYLSLPPLVKKNADQPLNIGSLIDASDYISKNEKPQNNAIETVTNDTVLSISDIKPTEEEKKEWLLSILQFQTNVFKEISKDSSTLSENAKLPNGTIAPPSENKRPIVNGDLSASKIPIKSKSSRLCKNLRNMPYQKTVSDIEYISETMTSLGESLKEKIEQNINFKINSFDQSLMEVLAYERIMSILAPPERKKIEMPNIPARALLCPLIPDITLKFITPKKSYSSEPVPMTFRILNIGKGSHNHVNLELFGNCNFISSQHAAVIYDQNTGAYELINYSEYGTCVDGISLNCNFSDKTVSEAAVPPILVQLKDIADRNRGFKKQVDEELVMNHMPGKIIERCDCRKSKQNGVGKGVPQDEATSHGWEGTSLLHHGSFIKFGCIPFVFSMVETAIHGEWANDVLTTYEKFLVRETDLHPIDSTDKQINLS